MTPASKYVAPAIGDFGARYYAPTLGRFLTPDWSATPEPIPYANFANPQSLNLYSYVLNNPASSTDPDGHWCILSWGTTCAKAKAPAKEGGVESLAIAAILDGLVQEGLRTDSAIARRAWYNFKGGGCGTLAAPCAGTVFPEGGIEELGDEAFGDTGAVDAAAAADRPPLRVIHPEETYSGGTAKLSLGKVRSMGTESIIDSLKPGGAEPLTVKPDGTILDGNTRITVLRERGVDVNSLPRVIHQ